VIVADDDGALALPIADAPQAVQAARKRIANEAAKREQLAGGTLGLDLYNLRPLLEELGVTYLDELP
jgi:4-hydroxy-4-methyl-2-oxoglutarate aldolase